MRIARNLMIEKEYIDSMKEQKKLSMSEIVNLALENYLSLTINDFKDKDEIMKAINKLKDDVNAHLSLGQDYEAKLKEEKIISFEKKYEMLKAEEQRINEQLERARYLSKLSSFNWTDENKEEYKNLVKEGKVRSTIEYIKLKLGIDE